MSTYLDNPCAKGHTSGRRKNGNCIQCEKERYRNDPARAEYIKQKQAERRAAIKADPVRLAEHQQYMRDYSAKNRNKLNRQTKDRYLRKNTEIRLKRKGIVPTTELLDYIQNHDGKCDLCGQLPDGRWKELTYDHCHSTGVFRGLLCNLCNKGLGLFKDNPELLQRASAYVSHYK